MSALITGRGLSRVHGARALFTDLNITLSEGDRLGVIGPNGAGKTTLLRILAGEEQADAGEVHTRRRLRVASVPQENVFDPDATVSEVVAAHSVLDSDLVEDQTECEVRVSIVLGQLGFPSPDQKTGELSGGWRKRLAIAAALASDPEVLLLDEPTNHLDLEGILWLEKLLLSSRVLAYLVISHDRTFLERVANRVAEVAPHYPEGVFTSSGGYTTFLEKRSQYLQARSQYRDSLANRVRREVEWLSRGPKARTTKANARIQEAERLQSELATLNTELAESSAGIQMVGSGRRTKRLVVAQGLNKSLGGRTLIRDLDLILTPGQRLGVVGTNGSGKSTLLRLLAGGLELDGGTLQRAEHLKIVYFDQAREQLDPAQPLKRALAPEGDMVTYRGNEVHVVGWAQRFQFRPEQLDQPIGHLSGGEQARVHIARLMLRPADLLLLDEPTNDLDIPTLEVLEESLLDFPGALVLVSHDRYLLDRATTVLLGLDGSGDATYFADVPQWLEAGSQGTTKTKTDKVKNQPKARRKGLTYLEKQEFEAMEQTILETETELEQAEAQMQDPSVVSDAGAAHEAFLTHEKLKNRVEQLYQRWSELELKESGG